MNNVISQKTSGKNSGNCYTFWEEIALKILNKNNLLFHCIPHGVNGAI